ncbi:MAG: TspO/MBR family protein [bacterium]|nr:TspO/MBR family protein [bacterium]
MQKNKKGLNLTFGQRFLLAFLPPALAGVFGSLTMIGGLQTWYSTLTKPFFNPPAWLFGPVWTLLYFLMGLATWIILNRRYSILEFRKRNLQREAVKFYLVQIILNFLWTPVFFAFQAPVVALFILVALLIVFVQMTNLYARLNRSTLWCLIPNLVWLCFATILNLSIVLLN